MPGARYDYQSGAGCTGQNFGILFHRTGVTMLIKLRRWLTAVGAFLFVMSVAYTAFTIDTSLKREALKKVELSRNSLKTASRPPPTSAASAPPPPRTTTSVKSSEAVVPQRTVSDASGSQLSRCQFYDSSFLAKNVLKIFKDRPYFIF
jgi:hypothetical protein